MTLASLSSNADANTTIGLVDESFYDVKYCLYLQFFIRGSTHVAVFTVLEIIGEGIQAETLKLVFAWKNRSQLVELIKFP